MRENLPELTRSKYTNNKLKKINGARDRRSGISMNKRLKKYLSLFLTLFTLVGNLPLETIGTLMEVQAQEGDTVGESTIEPVANEETLGVIGPKDFGSFRNVTHKIVLDEGHEELCKRTLTGEITFDWPEPSTYVDVVIVQDFSGSFDETIEGLGETVKSMINGLNFGTDVDGKSPKDRAMIVGFKGSDGMVQINHEDKSKITYYQFNRGVYDIASSELISMSNELDNWIDERYNPIYANGGTPTVDGLVEAQKLYEEATRLAADYNQSAYTVNGYDRKRKTVYILITDGAANTAKWSNLSEERQKEIADIDFYKYEELPSYHYEFYKNINGRNYYHDGYYYFYNNGYYYHTNGAFSGYYSGFVIDGIFSDRSTRYRHILPSTIYDWSNFS